MSSQIQKKINKILNKYGKGLQTKIKNICGKTGYYDVPKEIFQGRTARYNRVLIPWKIIAKNGFTYNQLMTFTNGVVVEFVNDDFFDLNNETNTLFTLLKTKIGSNEQVSAIISIRNEDKTPSSEKPREAFNKLINNTQISYKENIITITRENYQNYALKQIQSGGTGNEKWDGFLFVSIRGGQQNTIETHSKSQIGTQYIFNPICEYANKKVSDDILLVLSYFALLSISNHNTENDYRMYISVKQEVESYLENITYVENGNPIDLLSYCTKHPSTLLIPGKLVDPILVKEITIEDFNASRDSENALDLTHNEAVQHGNYYWDEGKNCIITPARPTNLFWTYHSSNMMMQNFTLGEYIREQARLVELRKNAFENAGIDINQIQ
jgi:hypothetical protein